MNEDSGENNTRAIAELKCAVSAIEDKKGEALRILDVRGKSSITDYLILVTGTSDAHLKALKAALDDAFKRTNIQLIGEDRSLSSGWLVVDAFDFMVHLQTEEMRDFYRLDQLWKDAMEVTL